VEGINSRGPKGRERGVGFLEGQPAPSAPAMGSGGALSAPPAGVGLPKLNLVHLSQTIWHLVTTND